VKSSGGVGLRIHLKDKHREGALKVLREASQVGEQVNESRGETLLHFMDFIRKNGRSKSSEEISRSSVGRWISQRCKELQCKCGKVLSSGGAEPLIQVSQGRWIIARSPIGIFVRKESKIW
jgi:hypothetical protein